MNAATNARLSELDGSLDAQELSPALADELFAVVDLLSAQASLRNAMSDPTAPDSARRSLATNVLTGRVSQPATMVVAAAAGLNWGSGAGLGAALERQAVRTLIGLAQRAGQLDVLEDELFRFARIVDADPALRAAVSDRSVPLADRQQIVSDLLGSKVLPASLALARRAVAGEYRTFDLTIEAYLTRAAEARQRAIAQVTVARPLTEEQAQRLKKALSSQVGREVTLQVVVDPAVMGGVRVQVGDEVIDGTVSNRLASAERQLN
ncbi:MAG: F0F1 ATP synthase subunit delta [Propionicimonas sp.]